MFPEDPLSVFQKRKYFSFKKWHPSWGLQEKHLFACEMFVTSFHWQHHWASSGEAEFATQSKIILFWFPRKNLDYNKVWSFGIKPCSNVQIRVFWGILPWQIHEGEKDLRIIYTNLRVLSCLCTQPGASELFIYPAVTYTQFRIPDKCRFKANFHFNVFVKLPPPD